MVSESTLPRRTEANSCCSSTRVKNALNPASSADDGQRDRVNVGRAEELVRAGEVHQVHDAEEMDERVGQEVEVRRRLLRAEAVPVAARRCDTGPG